MQSGKRRLYGTQTIPLPVVTDPRTRLVEGLMGLTAAGLFAVAIPLAIVLLAGQVGMTLDELLRAAGISLIVTMWIFTGIGLTATAIYSAILVLRKKTEAGAGWVAFGVVAGIVSGTFVVLARLSGAWVSVAASALILLAGLFDTIQAILKKEKSEAVALSPASPR